MIRIVASVKRAITFTKANVSLLAQNILLFQGSIVLILTKKLNVNLYSTIYVDTNYLIKAFYSIDSQDTETSLFNLISSSGTNFEKGNTIYFSYLKDRRIFGGALVWLNAKFGNTYSIP